MAPPDDLPYQHGTPKPDLEPQQPGESWSDYYLRTSNYWGKPGKTRYPWGEHGWPGTDPHEKGYKVDLDVHPGDLQGWARTLANDLDTLLFGENGDGGKDSAQTILMKMDSLSASQVGGWQGGMDFHGTLTAAQDGISEAHRQYVLACRTVIQKLLKSAADYGGTENGATAYVNGVLKRASALGDDGSQGAV